MEKVNLALAIDEEIFTDMTRKDVDKILLDRLLDDEELNEIGDDQMHSEHSSDDDVVDLPMTVETIDEGLKIAKNFEAFLCNTILNQNACDSFKKICNFVC